MKVGLCRRKLAILTAAAILAIPSAIQAASTDSWSYANFDNTTGINFASVNVSNGGAYQGIFTDDAARKVLRIGTSGAASDKQAVYHTDKVRVKSGFITEFTFRFWNNQPAGYGAEGIQFFIQRNDNQTAYGIYGPHNEFFGTKFDDYPNPGPGQYDPGVNNVGFRTGDQDQQATGSRDVPLVVTTDPNGAAGPAGISFRDGKVHKAKIFYGGDAPGVNQFKWNVTIDDIPVITDFIYDLAKCEGAGSHMLDTACYDGYGDAWIGFCGGTGGNSQNQDIISWSYTGYVAPTGVSGIIALPGYTGTVSDIGVTIDLIQGGNVVRTAKVFLDSNGYFNVPNVPAGTYDVTIKAVGWLHKTVKGVALPNDLGTVSLLGGDADGNNHIDTLDYSILSGNFGRDGD